MVVFIPKNQSITNFEIESVCKRYHIPLNGVFMKDELQELRHGYFVINLNSSWENGSHWCALVCDKRECIWFDSFGAPPPEEIMELLRKYYTKIHFNGWIVQNINNQSCGYYCIVLFMYLQLHRYEKKSIVQKVANYVNYFDDDTSKNYDILVKLAKELTEPKKKKTN